MELHLDGPGAGIQVWPESPRLGDRIHVAFRAARIVGAMHQPRYLVTVLDTRRRKVTALLKGAARAVGGVVCVEWDGVDESGALVPPGDYLLRIQCQRSPLVLERSLRLEV
jgi:hypothetical protein